MKYFKLAPPRLHSSKVLHKHSCISNKKQHPHFCIPTISYLVISSPSFFFIILKKSEVLVKFNRPSNAAWLFGQVMFACFSSVRTDTQLFLFFYDL